MPGLEELLTGRTLVKRYRIQEVIGRGGFAAVYRADDERLGRPVAVKVITYPAPDKDTLDELRARFQREARAAASMPQHPNIVTVHDFGIDPELQLDFLVMELLDGEDLATYLRRQDRPPLGEALMILRAATEGLCVGHRAGLVHRDVKPGNIFLARTHESDPTRVCVLDFGIALVLADEENRTQLTRGGLPHSPAYASPEQLRGDRLTAASDVFSLGVVAYQLLTGAKPFGEDRHAGAAAASVPLREIRDLNAGVPEAIAVVVERAMAYDPADRYENAGAFADALDEAGGTLVGATVAAAPMSPQPIEDRTLLSPEPAHAPRERGPIVAPPRKAPPRRRERSSSVLWVALVLLAVAAAAAAVWGLGGDDAASIDDPAAVVDEPDPIEAASGAEEADDEPVPTASEPGAGQTAPPVEMAPAMTPPVPADQTLPTDTAGGLPTGQPIPPLPRPARPDSALPQPDTTRQPPRLLGDPVRPDTTRPDTTAAARLRHGS